MTCCYEYDCFIEFYGDTDSNGRVCVCVCVCVCIDVPVSFYFGTKRRGVNMCGRRG